jgi:hypothetical protein
VSAVTGWLGPGVGAGSAALAIALQPALLVPILVTGATLGGLPLLLITTLALVAVYSPDPVRRAAAEKILDRLLTTLRPQDTSTRTRTRRRRTPTSGR